MTLFLREAEVLQLADMSTALECVAAVHAAHARGEAIDNPRQRTRTGSAILHILQGAWPARGVMGYKAYTTSKLGNRFWVHLFDSKNGDPLAMIEANALGQLRTGAASGVAAHQLARTDAKVAAVIGAGWQARGQILALSLVREIEIFQVYARNEEKLRAFCNSMSSQLQCKIVASASAQDALAEADIVTTVTPAAQPVLQADWIAPGMHLNAVGSNALIRRELDEATVRKAGLICVDSRATALREAGDLFPLLEKGKLTEGKLIELGELVAGFRPGRTSATDITLFESQGMLIQDLALAAEIYERACAAGIGQKLPIQ